jgi:putative membrane protein
MDTPIKEKPVADLRDYLAEERTFLAWIRTGIAFMGFGFVVARFGIFGDPTSRNRPSPVSRTSSHSGLASRLSRSV